MSIFGFPDLSPPSIGPSAQKYLQNSQDFASWVIDTVAGQNNPPSIVFTPEKVGPPAETWLTTLSPSYSSWLDVKISGSITPASIGPSAETWLTSSPTFFNWLNQNFDESLLYWVESRQSDSSGNDTFQWLPSSVGASTNRNILLSPVGLASFYLGDFADGVSKNARGNWATDLQFAPISLQSYSNTAVASGQASFAAGTSNTSSGDFSFTLGRGNVASGSSSGAMGFNNTVSSDNSFGAGILNLISGGDSNVVFGFQNSLNGTNACMVTGVNNTVQNMDCCLINGNNLSSSSTTTATNSIFTGTDATILDSMTGISSSASTSALQLGNNGKIGYVICPDNSNSFNYVATITGGVFLARSTHSTVLPWQEQVRKSLEDYHNLLSKLESEKNLLQSSSSYNVESEEKSRVVELKRIILEIEKRRYDFNTEQSRHLGRFVSFHDSDRFEGHNCIKFVQNDEDCEDLVGITIDPSQSSVASNVDTLIPGPNFLYQDVDELGVGLKRLDFSAHIEKTLEKFRLNKVREECVSKIQLVSHVMSSIATEAKTWQDFLKIVENINEEHLEIKFKPSHSPLSSEKVVSLKSFLKEKEQNGLILSFQSPLFNPNILNLFKIYLISNIKMEESTVPIDIVKRSQMTKAYYGESKPNDFIPKSRLERPQHWACVATHGYVSVRHDKSLNKNSKFAYIGIDGYATCKESAVSLNKRFRIAHHLSEKTCIVWLK